MSAWEERAQEETDSRMAGWMVTVSIIKDDDEIGHEMYAVAFSDPEPSSQP
jgi:hypothetical protein